MFDPYRIVFIEEAISTVVCSTIAGKKSQEAAKHQQVEMTRQDNRVKNALMQSRS